MIQLQQEKENQSVWRDPFFLGEVVSITGLTLVLVATFVVSLNPYVAIVVGLFLYVGFMVSMLKRKGAEDKRFSELLKAQMELEKHKIWVSTNVRPLTEDSMRSGEMRNAKFAMCEAIIQAFQETINDKMISEENRKIYQEAVKRIRDMQKSVIQIW